MRLRALVYLVGCVAVASVVAYLPEHAGLEDAGRASLWILVLAAGLWVTEAIPAFAVALVVIAVQVLVLGRPGGVLAGPEEQDAWRTFTDPWAAPPMWLFFGGLVLARAAERTGLARWMAREAVARTGGRGPLVLLVAMAVTFAFSMFISNTATAALMVGVLGPVLATGGAREARARAALLVGVAFAANVGGMATMIGTPPNAIAAGLLADVQLLSFLEWMLLGLPPALLIGVALAVALGAGRELRAMRVATPEAEPAGATLSEKIVVMAVFTATVLLWLSESWHGLPTAVVSFLPIVALSVVGVIGRDDVRALPWDVLILLAGGMSLGVGVAASGLAQWLALEMARLSGTPWVLALGLCYVTSVLSNLMSNTAAANLILPIAIALGLEMGGPVLAVQFAVPIALSASSAMCLPISTPPNAIVHATGYVRARDLLGGGVAVGLAGPVIAVAWCFPIAQVLAARG